MIGTTRRKNTAAPEVLEAADLSLVVFLVSAWPLPSLASLRSGCSERKGTKQLSVFFLAH